MTSNSGMITVYPQESNEILLNPGKGWILYSNQGNAYGVDTFAQQSEDTWSLSRVAYHRFSWAVLEPEEQIYNWSLIDHLLEEVSAKGKKLVLGIMNANSCSPKEDVPEWVWEAGAANITLTTDEPLTNQRYTKKIPVWDGNVFMDKLKQFYDAFQSRYDGHPDLEFVDVRNFGNWGEWHLEFLDGSHDIALSKKKEHIDMWNDFKRTPLIIPYQSNFDYLDDFAQYAVDKYGMGLRRDGIVKLTESHLGAAYAFGIAPTVGEFYGPYEWVKNDGTWSDEQLDRLFEEGKFSYMGMGQWGGDAKFFLSEKRSLIEKWANRMGYWFRMTEAQYPVNIGNECQETIDFVIRNDGVAPIYVNKNRSFVKLVLMDNRYKVLTSILLDEVNPYDWKPGKATRVTASFHFPYQATADKIALGIFSDSSLQDPDILLGISNKTVDGWYVLTDMPSSVE